MNSNNHNDRNKSNPRFGQKSGTKDASHGSDKNKVAAPANQQKQETPKTTKPTENPEN
jgi:hypothetical protein